jgi:hypothetical protein
MAQKSARLGALGLKRGKATEKVATCMFLQWGSRNSPDNIPESSSEVTS